MHFYWRIIEELKFLGESWVFNDPNLSRCYGLWIKKNADVIAPSPQETSYDQSEHFAYKNIPHSLN
jgi:hypothetical protein